MGDLRPECGFHLCGHPPVNPADPIVEAAAAQGKAGHIEAVAAVQPEGIHPLHILANRLGNFREVLHDQLLVKNIMPCRHRRMGGKYCARRHQFQGTVEVQALLHAKAAALQDLKSRMSLIDVPHGGPQAQGAQRSYSTHTQYQLLLQAHFYVATV